MIYVIIEQSKELSDRWKTVSAIQNNQYLSDEQKKILTSKFDNHQIKIFNKSFLDKEFINQLSKTFPTTKNLIYHYSNEIVDVLAHHYVSKDANGNLQIFSMEGAVKLELNEELAQIFTQFFSEEINHLITLDTNQYIPISFETILYYINVAMLNPIHISIDDYYQLEYLKKFTRIIFTEHFNSSSVNSD